MDCIYLDNNATTPPHPAVLEAMRPYQAELCGNPASAHAAGRRARRALEDARETIAQLLDADPDEVVFTSGGTEANNLAVFGLAGAGPGHMVVSPIEHPSVAEPVRRLAEGGFVVERLPVDPQGVVEFQRLPELVRPETRLVAVMRVNHETGALQPIRELVDRASPVPFHCDGVQAAGKVPVRFHQLGVTALSLSAHKFHGPKGIGALLVRRGLRLAPLLWGGHQQQGRRPGTEPVPLAVGMAKALELWQQEAEQRTAHVLDLRRRFLDYLHAHAAPVVLNGPSTLSAVGEGRAVPHTLNLSFPGCQAEPLLMNLDLAGVACSTGSACSSGSLLPSPVLRAMGVPTDILRSAMRFSLSPLLTAGEVDEAARRVAVVVERLRRTAEK